MFRPNLAQMKSLLSRIAPVAALTVAALTFAPGAALAGKPGLGEIGNGRYVPYNAATVSSPMPMPGQKAGQKELNFLKIDYSTLLLQENETLEVRVHLTAKEAEGAIGACAGELAGEGLTLTQLSFDSCEVVRKEDQTVDLVLKNRFASPTVTRDYTIRSIRWGADEAKLDRDGTPAELTKVHVVGSALPVELHPDSAWIRTSDGNTIGLGETFTVHVEGTSAAGIFGAVVDFNLAQQWPDGAKGASQGSLPAVVGATPDPTVSNWIPSVTQSVSGDRFSLEITIRVPAEYVRADWLDLGRITILNGALEERTLTLPGHFGVGVRHEIGNGFWANL